MSSGVRRKTHAVGILARQALAARIMQVMSLAAGRTVNAVVMRACLLTANAARLHLRATSIPSQRTQSATRTKVSNVAMVTAQRSCALQVTLVAVEHVLRQEGNAARTISATIFLAVQEVLAAAMRAPAKEASAARTKMAISIQ